MSNDINRIQLFSSFLETAVPKGTTCPNCEWLFVLHSTQATSLALQSSIAAMCLAAFGKLNADENLQHESAITHKQALLATQAALRNPLVSYSDDTLAACEALLLYDFYAQDTYSDGTVYLKNLEAFSRLVYLRGPEQYKEGLAHSLFRNARLLEA